MTGAGSTARTSCTRARSRTGTAARSARRGTSTCTCCWGHTAGRSAARCRRSGSARHSPGTSSAACRRDRPSRTGRRRPHRRPRCRDTTLSSSAGALAASQSIVSGRPFISTTTYGLPVSAIACTAASCWPGRPSIVRDDASPLSDGRLADHDHGHVRGLAAATAARSRGRGQTGRDAVRALVSHPCA